MVKHREDSITAARKKQEEKDTEIQLLKAQLRAAAERTEFLEDCVAEMAAQVYSV